MATANIFAVSSAVILSFFEMPKKFNII